MSWTDQGSSKVDYEFPDLQDAFGEVAVRDAISTLIRPDIDETMRARIRGIDYIDRIRVFAAVENRTRGRERVLEMLHRRRQHLEEVGERDERLEVSR